MAQVFTTGGDGPEVTRTTRCPCRCKGGTLPDQLHHVGTVEPADPREHAGAQFDDYGSVFHGNEGLEK